MNDKVKTVDKQVLNHVITIDNRKKMMLTGIVEVVSATEKTIVAKLTDKTIYILGADLRVSKLNLEETLLIVEGMIDSFKYAEISSSKGFFKRVFK